MADCQRLIPTWAAYKIHLADNARVLALRNIAAMRTFQSEYGRGREYEFFGSPREYWIDWFTVASDYDAIIIAPYEHAYLFEMSWYAGWDCASGCIWNAKAIAGVEEVTPP